MNDEVLTIVVNWWANRIIDTKHDNGAYDFTNFMANSLADMGVEKLTEEQIEGFKKDLKEEINEMYKEWGNCGDLYLGCDYSPCVALRNAAKKNNIPELNFPFKVSMWFSNAHVVVKNGYGAEMEILYATKEYYLERIESCKRSIKRYENHEYDWLSVEEEKERIVGFEEEIKKYEQSIKELESND